jgi:hypothetical protein
MRSNIIVSFLFYFVLLGSAGAQQGAAGIYNSAIADANRLRGNVPIEQRLEIYSRIFSSLDKILTDHPDSGEARLLLSGQESGGFSPDRLRVAYVTDLQTYHGTTCEVSPSYRCLGFVSLRDGGSTCASAADFPSVFAGARNLGNAVRVFKTRDNDQQMLSLALSLYRGCITGKNFLSEWQRDWIASDLVDLLLDSQSQPAARALIQGMKTPYFRFVGVLQLRRLSGQPFNSEFFERMDRFISERLATENVQAAALAKLQLRIDGLRQNGRLVITDSDLFGLSRFMNFTNLSAMTRSGQSCDPYYVRFLFNAVLDYQSLLSSVALENRARVGNDHFMNIANAAANPLNA